MRPRDVLRLSPAETSFLNYAITAKYEKMKGYDLKQLSLDTVKMFYNDAIASGFKL